MPRLCEETPSENQEKLLTEKLGRELTPREKFYLAFAKACAPQRGKPLILCVDDDPAQLQLRKQILEKDGLLVLSATSAREAVQMLREAPVSLVLSDHMLQETTGTQLAAKIEESKT